MANFELFFPEVNLAKIEGLEQRKHSKVTRTDGCDGCEDGLGGYGPFSGEFFRSYRMEFTSQGSSTLGRPQMAWAF